MEMIRIEMVCPFCGQVHSVVVAESDYLAWCRGVLIQNAFPDLNATEREQLISHICPDCQESIFD